MHERRKHWQIQFPYLLALLLGAVKVRRKNTLCNLIKAFLGGLFDAADGRQPLDEAAAMLLNSICSILTNLLHERHRFDRLTCSEEQN